MNSDLICPIKIGCDCIKKIIDAINYWAGKSPNTVDESTPIDRLKQKVDYSYAQKVVILNPEINLNTVMPRL
ncbi:hypothetical protein AB1282_17960 [Gottfriedia sp. S16(2024)]|uniref:hypothetical protein n=1 Tax=Gottfriedia sp. S16(2024) TaxID=3162883 RepID=UPI003D1EB945